MTEDAEVIENMQAEVAAVGVRLIDDTYLAWSHAKAECDTTLRAWFQSTGERRERAYLVYRASLHREEASARDLETPLAAG